MMSADLSVLFFVQIAVIITACRLIGWIGQRYLGQPLVVGEMIAGIVLGPSLLGLVAPDLQAALFSKAATNFLYVGAQLGVGLYMFLVGMEFDRSKFQSNLQSAAAVSLSGMIGPVLVALLLAPWLMATPGLFSDRLSQIQATLFMGACISITAFPVLARIMHERGLSKTPLGSLLLSVGAINDAGAWTILAVLLATLGEGPGIAVKAVAGAAIFAILILKFGSFVLRPLGRAAEKGQGLGQGLLAIVLVLFLCSALTTELIGLHSVFGGFLLGLVMPRGVLTREIRKKLEPLTVVLLLPMFFTFSGLQTQLFVVTDPALLLVTLVILAASILSKGGTCWLAARLTGQDNSTALGIGALMNARGLMELIIINIGLSRGIIGPALFAMLVLMALVTTLMATPMFELLYGRQARRRGNLGSLADVETVPTAKPKPQALIFEGGSGRPLDREVH